MSNYQFEKRPCSCFVDVQLIRALEQYVLKWVTDNCGITIEDARKNFSVCMSDRYGRESLHSIGEYPRERFSNDTQVVSLCYDSFETECKKIKISLGRNLHITNIEVNYAGPGAAEKTRGIVQHIESMLRESRNFNFLLAEPWNALLLLPYTAALGLLFWGLTSFLDSLKAKLVALVTFGVIGFALMAFTIVPWPYCELDSQRASRQGALIRWFIKGFVGTLIFSLLLPFAWRAIHTVLGR